MNIPKKILPIFIFAVVAFWPNFAGTADSDLSIRVAILKNVDDFELTLKGAAQVKNPLTGQTLETIRSLRHVRVEDIPQGIKIGDELYALKRLRIVPEEKSTIQVENRRYRGAIEIIKTPKNQFTVVNTIDLEEYVRGILYHEMPHRWPLEALKVQAVAARTYALYRVQQARGQDFDVTSDIYSQVYGGESAERYRTNIAVKKTKGEVMTYTGKVVPAYFHATCGGHTEEAGELWNTVMPPLKGVPCPFCADSPHYRWKKNFRSKDIQDKLNQNGYDLWLIKEISVLERNPSGRVRKLLIRTRDGKDRKISGKDFREIIGPNFLKSNSYHVEMKGYFFDVLGKGWGHGVGMCQWGAHGMAFKRYKYDQILKYYYPGVDIVNYKTVVLVPAK